LTNSFSADSFALFSAFAIADFKVFRKWKAAFRSLNSTIFRASATGNPFKARAKSLDLEGVSLTNLVIA
jgi:hypothetical protein